MPIETTINDNPSRSKPPKSKTWIYVFLGFILVLGAGYYGLLNQTSASINHDFYRVLYEASNRFNENLNSLNSMHQAEESEVSIRSFLPSYSRQTSSSDELKKNEFVYTLTGQKVEISNAALTASIDLEDLLPITTEGFSQYLFADSEGKVLANTGGEKTISIVELKSINHQLQKDSNTSFINFNTKDTANKEPSKAPLPSYSSHVDMQLSYGSFRIFIFPFTLSTPLSRSNGETIERLYLVGLLPKHKLQNKGSGHWNISLLIVTMSSLLFMWALIRLFLLPENQSITKFYRALSQAANYLFYIVLVALILAYLTKSGLQSYKDQRATQYAKSIANNLENDLKEVFYELSSFRDFYSTSIAELNKLKSIGADTDKGTSWSKQTILQAHTKALNALAKDKDNCDKCTLDKPLPNVISNDQWYEEFVVKHTVNLTSIIDNIFGKSSSHIVETQTQPINTNSSSSEEDTYYQEASKLGAFSFYSGDLKVAFDHKNNIFNSYIPKELVNPSHETNSPYKASKILTVFATDEKGYGNLPSFYFQEANSKPQTFQLSHRDYFKNVRDYKGWLLDFSIDTDSGVTDPRDVVFRNVYIQRLLNINDGSRGSTISVPMHQPHLNMPEDMGVAGYLLAADVILPSVSLAPPSDFDFVFMVVDRNTGKVLFHTDEDRSLVENIFYAGHSESHLSQWIQAGLDKQPQLGGNQIDGFYHGEAGRYTLTSSKIDDWAIVVFSPNDSLDSFMTNQFMYILVTFLFLLGIVFVSAKVTRFWVSGKWLRLNLGLPYQLDSKRLMLICTALFTTNYGLFYIGQLLQVSFPEQESWHSLFSPILPLVGVALLLVILFKYYINYFKPNKNKSADINIFKKGAILFSVGLWLVALIHFAYLQFSAGMPLQSLQFYYAQQKCNGENKEFVELTQIAIKRFPNTVTQQRVPPFSLLPMEKDWQQKMLDKINVSNNKQVSYKTKNTNEQCEGYLSSVKPSDYPKMSTLVGSTYLWKWIKTYLINPDKQDEQDKNIKSTEPRSNPEYDLIITSILILMALVWVWFYFNRKVLWPRIYCPRNFLYHIEELCESVSNMAHERPKSTLSINIDSHKMSGVGIALLLRSQKVNVSGNLTNLMPNFIKLFQISPCLQLFSQNDTFLPNLKMDVTPDKDTGLLDVKIWDIETCLEKVEFRQHLLDMIMEIKSLTVNGNLNSFTIFSGFMSFRRVKIKDQFSKVENSALEHAEYMSWSECLIDFTVTVTSEFVHNVNPEFLNQELKFVPELQYLGDRISINKKSGANQPLPSTPLFWQKTDQTIKSSEWATIHYILLHADALYRFKWESCSNGEKLALYNLAKKHRLNPRNTEMIEHLAINGMIKVRSDHLAIVNKSFAHFVLHAESKETLNKLITDGEAGVWNSYRLPLALLIILIIGGIAVTSGQSIFIIIASLAGVLGTIGSLTNSASVLKNKISE
ncbi:hypothetical protein [Paraglaciecola sp.]|uniref:hypothetical protein n=1 Tax=Paraglaciecola sp. TaxID=1920173 RepID=UPI003EF4EAE4